ncbi:fibronectin type III domain-containing protein [Apilactobacillus sp. TMW 2.2459]|uniref:fibronectin type III domain-containing protein n=1 Tax=Apilactobacillus xinyiensis TaxID=2841032 RepID=UPI00200FCCEE|nr:fibronectin type III domain-containing protein [Apilactobacillus xinyiensis]MCL0312778.1 fibronectin type III domain-containing protein [Apilactobacillus xinyiensis]
MDSVKQTIKPDTPLPAYVYADSDGNQQLSDTGTIKSKTATTIPLLFSNKDVTDDYYIKAIGLYAHDENRNVDILYSVMTAPEPRLQPAYDGTAPTSFKVKSITAVGLTKSLKVELSDFDNVSQGEFHETLKGYATIAYVDNKFITADQAKTLIPKLPDNIVIATKPEAPVLTITANDTSVDYQITPPLYFGRAEIEKYVLYYKKHADTDYSSVDVDIHNLNGNLPLKSGNQYDFKATAVNQSYESDSTQVQSYVLGKVPYNVKLTYTVDVPNKTINYNITADSPADTPITSYRTKFKDATNDSDKNFGYGHQDTTTSSGQIKNCILGHSYYLIGAAINTVGPSNLTDVQTVTVGNVPTNVQLNLSSHYSSGTTVWSATADTDSGPITSYKLYYRSMGSTDWQTDTSGSVRQLFGSTYEFKATAINVVGESQPSAVQTVLMATKPYNCKLTNVNSDYSAGKVTWSATASSNNIPITNYTIYYRDVDANGNWQSTTNNSITGLTSGHMFELKATATNAAGESDYSDIQKIYYGDFSMTSLFEVSFSKTKDGSVSGSLVTANYSVNSSYLNKISTNYSWSSSVKFILGAQFGYSANSKTTSRTTSRIVNLGELSSSSIVLNSHDGYLSYASNASLSITIGSASHTWYSNF